jgi:hypothetical protein
MPDLLESTRTRVEAEPGVVLSMAKQGVTNDRIHKVLGEGDFVLVVRIGLRVCVTLASSVGGTIAQKLTTCSHRIAYGLKLFDP